METSTNVSSLLLADGNNMFRRGLKFLVSTDARFQVCGEASTFSEVVEQLRLLTPDFLMIGAEMLGTSGPALNLTILARQMHPSLRILILSPDHSSEILDNAKSIGALGVLLKDSSPDSLLAALASVAFQETETIPARTTGDLRALAVKTSRTSGVRMLTLREREVARMLAEGRTVRAVARDLALSPKTVEAHKLNLMRKLDLHDRASLAAYADRHGMLTPVNGARQ